MALQVWIDTSAACITLANASLVDLLHTLFFTLFIMRKIEAQMIQAINNNAKSWKSGNTKVVTTTEGYSHVYLHNNHIATVNDHAITLYDGGWRSNTTKSRLNAILTEHGAPSDRVFQCDFQWFITTHTGTERFTNGVTLT